MPFKFSLHGDRGQELAGSCREFLLTLRDGTTHPAYVSFR